MGKKILIVGGSAGGAATATRLKRIDPTAEIIIYEKTPYISYSSCALPYFIGNLVEDRRKIFVKTPTEMEEENNIKVKINSEIISIDTMNNLITVKDKDSIYTNDYDYLVISPGAKPSKPDFPGIESPKIFTLRNVPDADKIKQYINKAYVKSVAIVGGGYIGIEMAENLKNLGIRVTVVQSSAHILPPFDFDMVELIEEELKSNEVKLILSDPVKAFYDNGDIIETTLTSGVKLNSDIVILSIGIKPDISFLNGSGIELGEKGHILVNSKMQTNFNNVFALGDAVETLDLVSGFKTNIALASPAARQADIVANNIMGIEDFYKGSLGSALIKVFELTCGCTGDNEKNLKKYNIPYKVIYTEGHSSASAYPGSKVIKFKLIFSENGKILGAQILGEAGVDKRTDIIATLISLGGTVFDAAKLQLAYAPPYSTPTDIINIVGLKASKKLKSKNF
ncbi:coenzyme A disulfide reductase [Clostridium homopropionicum DSM 5847]|uniref:Coenzyme A disulfide reductase n=1 Tax=Clostridium homopropionicum DSM 5847 TaxID=1121318 RepID=A0A0L6ZEI8_9CLOT|nr:FAD-dependent oxidoreductase [Clostridium homopropionicum]KOA21391.1 coenzyme A disulfide reductase [Clostridium homopropionicum DSM 5847]SFG11439.1 NADPH-dependent 2,4-dienoyl-CoA reductase, sulfur reductase [Clostridium homopropionicum]